MRTIFSQLSTKIYVVCFHCIYSFDTLLLRTRTALAAWQLPSATAGRARAACWWAWLLDGGCMYAYVGWHWQLALAVKVGM